MRLGRDLIFIRNADRERGLLYERIFPARKKRRRVKKSLSTTPHVSHSFPIELPGIKVKVNAASGGG